MKALAGGHMGSMWPVRPVIENSHFLKIPRGDLCSGMDLCEFGESEIREERASTPGWNARGMDCGEFCQMVSVRSRLSLGQGLAL